MIKIDIKKDIRVEFTKEMKKEYTILLPMMLPIHFELIKNVLNSQGYKAELLRNNNPNIAKTGLKYVHNDTCFPAILVIGQFIDALSSGKYDPNKTALMITQTGGGCRASNYIHLLRKALKKAGYPNVPVISLNLSGLEKNSGFKLTLPLLKKMLFCLIYGDCLMSLRNQVEPYEVNLGDSEILCSKWIDTLSKQISSNKNCGNKWLRQNLDLIANDFSDIKTNKSKKIKVGIVGEIYIKYSAVGNNDLEEFLKLQDCEICVPGILGFMMFKLDNRIEDINLYGGSKLKYYIYKTCMSYLINIEKIYSDTIKKYKMFRPVPEFNYTKSSVKGIIGYGNKMGEGWFLTAEMIELIKSGFNNIVCAQPFGCLPNHICARGMIHKITSFYPKANIVAVDYDSGASKVNQENRIKLMLAIASEYQNP